MKFDGREMGEAIVAQVRAFMARELKPWAERIDSLERREPIAGPAGKDGANGTPGEQGPQGDAGPAGRDGQDADMEEVKAFIAGAVAALPQAKDGTPGADGRDGRDGAPGESVHPDTVRAMLLEMVGKAISELPKPKDGEPGRDANQIDYRDGIDESKSYPRGTHALYRGGSIVAMRATDPVTDGDILKAGWAVSHNGVASETEESLEDGRLIRRTTVYTDGKSFEREHRTSIALHRGVWKTGTEYTRGDMVSWDGSTWHCEDDTTTSKPGPSGGWKLVVKRGNHAKSPYDIAVSHGFKGTEKEWLDSLRGPPGPEAKPTRSNY